MINLTDTYVPSTDYVQHCFVLAYHGPARVIKLSEFKGWLEEERKKDRDPDYTPPKMSAGDKKRETLNTADVLRRYVSLVPKSERTKRIMEFYRWFKVAVKK